MPRRLPCGGFIMVADSSTCYGRLISHMKRSGLKMMMVMMMMMMKKWC